MPELITRCPLTSRPVATGVLVDAAVLDTGDAAIDGVVWCPYCFGVHPWTERTVWPNEAREDRAVVAAK